MCSVPIKIGIIGGSGLDDPELLEKRNEITVDTPFGEPSDNIIEGEIKGVQCAILARHGRKHSINPTNINYRANIWAFKLIGCTHLIVSNATGSLREHIRPGDLVVPHDYIDRTTKREQTFYDGSEDSPVGVCHLPMYPAFNEKARQVIIQTTKEMGFKLHESGVIVVIEGPRFSSRAESLAFRQWGGEIIGMTTCPEVVLAKEAGLIYGAICMATDYDCWREGIESVTHAAVLEIFCQNVAKVRQILLNVVENIGKLDWDAEISEVRKLASDSIILPK